MQDSVLRDKWKWKEQHTTYQHTTYQHTTSYHQEEHVQLLREAEKQFLLCHFESTITLCYQLLHSLSALHPDGTSHPPTTLEAVGMEHLMSLYHQCDYQKVRERSVWCTCLGVTERVQLQKCSCITSTSILLQSMFRLPHQYSPMEITSFLWTFYGNIRAIPFPILFLRYQPLGLAFFFLLPTHLVA